MPSYAFSEEFEFAWEQASDARVKARHITEKEMWRFVPEGTHRILMTWTDDPNSGGRLCFEDCRDENGVVLLGQDWAFENEQQAMNADALDSLCSFLADYYDEASSNFLQPEDRAYAGLRFYIERTDNE